jgi:mannose-6-phosphate isomerase-like protein (cupin superfamily)
MPDNIHIEEIEEQAALFALGALPAEEAMRFEQRLAAGCPLCRAELQACERTVTALPLSIPEVEPRPGLRARLLQRIGGREEPKTKSPFGQGAIVRPGDTEWEQLPVPGVQRRALLGGKTMLVRMAPKTWLPAHDHAAAEQCLVLEGSISSEGATAYAGDFTYMPAGSSHQPLYSEEGCLLLIAYT